MTATAGGAAEALMTLPGSSHPIALGAVRRASTYVPEVDAIRGIAMTAVVLFHCKLLPFGWMGVWLFYVVSGFSVTTSLLSRRRGATGIGGAIGGFYMRRALRIWPLYFGFIALNVVALELLGYTAPLADLPWLLTFTQNVNMILLDQDNWPAFGHLWTLAVEQQFYLVFPLLLLLRNRSSRAIVLFAVIAAAPLIRAGVGDWAAGLGWVPGRVAFAVYAFGPTHFDAFAVGSLIAMFRDEISGDQRYARAAMLATAAVIVLYVVIYATLNVVSEGTLSVDAMRNIISGILFGQGREITVYLLPTCVAATMLVGILSAERFCLSFCRLPGLQAVGRISYGGYLFHIPVLMLLGAFVPIFWVAGPGPLWVASHLALFVCAFALTVTIAWLSFTFFEQRFTRLRWR